MMPLVTCLENLVSLDLSGCTGIKNFQDRVLIKVSLCSKQET